MSVTIVGLVVRQSDGKVAVLRPGVAADGKVLGWDNAAMAFIWTSGAGGPPSGAAGGELAGTYPNPTISTSVMTAAGRALVDDASAAAQRTTLGLGTAATTAATDYDATGAASSAYASAASDLSIHAAAADPHTGYQREAEKDAASGYAGLDANARVPANEIPTGVPSAPATDVHVPANYTLVAPDLVDMQSGFVVDLASGALLVVDPYDANVEVLPRAHSAPTGTVAVRTNETASVPSLLAPESTAVIDLAPDALVVVESRIDDVYSGRASLRPGADIVVGDYESATYAGVLVLDAGVMCWPSGANECLVNVC